VFILGGFALLFNDYVVIYCLFEIGLARATGRPLG
jgi:hypothetical protein